MTILLTIKLMYTLFKIKSFQGYENQHAYLNRLKSFAEQYIENTHIQIKLLEPPAPSSGMEKKVAVDIYQR